MLGLIYTPLRPKTLPQPQDFTSTLQRLGITPLSCKAVQAHMLDVHTRYHQRSSLAVRLLSRLPGLQFFMSVSFKAFKPSIITAAVSCMFMFASLDMTSIRQYKGYALNILLGSVVLAVATLLTAIYFGHGLWEVFPEGKFHDYAPQAFEVMKKIRAELGEENCEFRVHAFGKDPLLELVYTDQQGTTNKSFVFAWDCGHQLVERDGKLLYGPVLHNSH